MKAGRYHVAIEFDTDFEHDDDWEPDPEYGETYCSVLKDELEGDASRLSDEIHDAQHFNARTSGYKITVTPLEGAKP